MVAASDSSIRALGADARALLDFALAHAQVTGFIGSRQHTDSDRYRLEERTLADYNLIYVWEGSARWVIEDEPHPLPQGQLLVVPPGARHHGRSTAPIVTFGSVHVLAALPGGRDLFELFSVPRSRAVAPGCRLDRIFRLAMEEYLANEPSLPAMIMPWSELVLKELLRHDAAAGLLALTGADPLVPLILRFLERHLSRSLPLAEIARQAGYSAQHLNRRFQRAVGATPLECLADLRWRRACTLLRAGSLSIQAIGAAVGCPDAAYFSRSFHARFQLTPSAYRSQAGSGSPR